MFILNKTYSHTYHKGDQDQLPEELIINVCIGLKVL